MYHEDNVFTVNVTNMTVYNNSILIQFTQDWFQLYKIWYIAKLEMIQLLISQLLAQLIEIEEGLNRPPSEQSVLLAFNLIHNFHTTLLH